MTKENPSPKKAGFISRNNDAIKIEGSLTNSNLQHLLSEIYQSTEKAGFQEIILDFRHCTFAYGDTMLALCAQIMAKRHHGYYIKIELPESDLSKLFVNTNWAHLLDPRRYDPSARNTYQGNISATQYNNSTEQHNIVNRVVNVMLGFVPDMERSDFEAFEWSLNEITDNVLTHSSSQIGGLVQLSFIKSKKRVQYMVADAGIGIPNSMRSGAYPTISDIDSLDKAVREGVTRDKNLGQGNGLFGSFQISHDCGGMFYIRSGNAHLIYSSKDGFHVTKDNVPYHGTLVSAEVDFSHSGLLSAALKFGGKQYIPSNTSIGNDYETSDGYLIFKLKIETESFGSRLAGSPVRNKLLNIYKMKFSDKIKIDFEDVPLMSSSFADEVFGKLFKEIGPLEFMSRIEFVNISDISRSLINKAITQRMKV